MSVVRTRLSDEDAERNVGRVVKTLATASGTQIQELADLLGMHLNGLSDRIAGRRQFRVAELAALARYFEVDAGVFFRPAAELVGISPALSGRRPSAGSGSSLRRSGWTYEALLYAGLAA